MLKITQKRGTHLIDLGAWTLTAIPLLHMPDRVSCLHKALLTVAELTLPCRHLIKSGKRSAQLSVSTLCPCQTGLSYRKWILCPTHRHCPGTPAVQREEQRLGGQKGFQSRSQIPFWRNSFWSPHQPTIWVSQLLRIESLPLWTSCPAHDLRGQTAAFKGDDRWEV